MKRTGILLIVIIAIVIGYSIITRIDSKLKPSDASDRDFAVNEIDEIYRMTIYQPGIETIELKKRNSQWFVFDSLKARQNPVDNLLETVGRLKISYIPERAAIKNILRDIRSIGIHVKIYNRREQLIKAYVIGAVTPDERGTYMVMEGSGQPYVMHLPNLEGGLRGRYLLNPIDWRDRTVLAEDIDNIKSVKVEYLKNQAESFQIVRTKSRFHLEPLFQEVYKNPVDANENLIKNYLHGYSILVAEYIENENPNKENIRRLVPFAVITIHRQDDSAISLRLFPVDDLLSDELNTMNTESAKLVNRYFVDCSWGDFMLVQQRLIGKILRAYSYFFSE